MRRRIGILLIFLLAGAVVNVAVAWTCALAIDPLGAQGVHAGRIGADTYNQTIFRWSRPGAVVVISVRRPWKYGSSREWGDVTALLDKWTGYQVPTPEWESGTMHSEERHAQACGWPMLTLWCETHPSKFAQRPHNGGIATGLVLTTRMKPNGSITTIPRALPLRPIWLGFAVNTVFYTAILGSMFYGMAFLRRAIRRRRGLCPACGYDLGHAEHESCPECGVA